MRSDLHFVVNEPQCACWAHVLVSSGHPLGVTCVTTTVVEGKRICLMEPQAQIQKIAPSVGSIPLPALPLTE